MNTTNKILPTSEVISIAAAIAHQIGGAIRLSGYANPVSVTACQMSVRFSVPGKYSGQAGYYCVVNLNYAGQPMAGNGAPGNSAPASFVASCHAAVAAAL